MSHHLIYIKLYSIFFFREFQLITSVSDDKIKTLISFWCMRGLNSRSPIQQSEILPVGLTGTHNYVALDAF